MRHSLLLIALLVSLPRAAAEDPAPPAAATETEADRVKRISQELETLRGKKFKEPVKIAHQTAEEFRKFVEAQIDKELPPAEAAAQSKALQALGLLPKGYDLRKGLADLYVSQAGAYYNPETKTFYMLVVSLPQNVMDDLILHELMHALQDQYFDLAPALAKASAAKNDDVATAFSHIVEGEAMYITLRKQLEAMGVKMEGQNPMAEMASAQVRDMPREMLVAMTQQVAGTLGPEGAELKKAMEALSGVPEILFWMLHSPYMKGQFAVHRAFARGGWSGVDGLFEKPPTSTEQVLHPEKAQGEKRDEPTPILDSKDWPWPVFGEGWQLVRANALGELGTFVFLDQHAISTRKAGAGAAAEGWDGDRYRVYEKEGALALHWYSVWDTPEDAKEFADALRAITRQPIGTTAVHQKGTKVLFVDGPATAVAVIGGVFDSIEGRPK